PFVAHHLAVAAELAHPAVGAHDALVHAEGAVVHERERHRRGGARAVLGMDALEVALERGPELARMHAVDGIHLVGPGDAPAHRVPFPAAEAGELLRLREERALL